MLGCQVTCSLPETFLKYAPTARVFIIVKKKIIKADIRDCSVYKELKKKKNNFINSTTVCVTGVVSTHLALNADLK